jgi:uncharacterized membrane protein
MPTKVHDEYMGKVISYILSTGLVLASLAMFAGGAVYLVQHGLEASQSANFHGEPTRLRTFSGIISGAAAGRGQHLIQLGVLLLIATPILRVAFSVLAYCRQRDYAYACISMIVLSVIAYSFWSAI